MGFNIDRQDNLIRIHIDDADDIDCYLDEQRIYFLYDYLDHEQTDPNTVELIVNLILSRMMKRFTQLMIVTQNESGMTDGIYMYPCSFKEFEYDYEMEDVFCHEYLVGYIDLPDVSDNELKFIEEVIRSSACWHDNAISVIYEDIVNQVGPIVDMLSGKGSDFFDKMVVNSNASVIIPYLTKNGLTVEDLQRNFNNLQLINKEQS